ncbi:hypothetical protein ACOTXK_00005, partial [Enterobacter cloacae complex sp. IR5376]
QIREILISESAWEEMTCLFAPSLNIVPFRSQERIAFHLNWKVNIVKIPMSVKHCCNMLSIFSLKNNVLFEKTGFFFLIGIWSFK